MNKLNLNTDGWVYRNEINDLEPDWDGPDWIGSLRRIDGKNCFKINNKDVNGCRILTKEDMVQIIKWMDKMKPLKKQKQT